MRSSRRRKLDTAGPFKTTTGPGALGTTLESLLQCTRNHTARNRKSRSRSEPRRRKDECQKFDSVNGYIWMGLAAQVASK